MLATGHAGVTDVCFLQTLDSRQDTLITWLIWLCDWTDFLSYLTYILYVDVSTDMK